MGKPWKQWLTIFLGSKITADGGFRHELKTLTPWKESYAQPRQHIKCNVDIQCNIDIQCNVDITLSTKVRLVKAIVFEVVVYACESWTIKKAERRIIDAFELLLEKTLESPLNCKEISPECSLEGLMLKLKLQNLGHLM